MKQHLQFILGIVLIQLFFLIPGVQAAGDEEKTSTLINPDKIAGAQLEDLNIDELKGFWEDIINKYDGYLPESQKGSLYDFISGEKKFSLKEWFKGILNFAFHEFIVNGKLLGSLILLTVFSMFLQALQNSFEKSTISKVAYSIVFMVLIIIALNSFHVVVDYTNDTISTMIQFILALIPLLLALMATSGGLISAAFFPSSHSFYDEHQRHVHPVCRAAALISFDTTQYCQHSVRPLQGHTVGQYAPELECWAAWDFTDRISGCHFRPGASSAVTDGVTVKTAKFITGNFVPVIGRVFTDATDTVISASMLLKNTVGLAGVAILLIIAAFPAVKILMVAFIYKFAAAILQPLGGGPVITCLDVISKSIIYVFAALGIVSLMFFLTITVIIAAGNLTMMVR